MPSAGDTIFVIELTGKQVALVTAVLDAALVNLMPQVNHIPEEVLEVCNRIVEQVNEQSTT